MALLVCEGFGDNFSLQAFLGIELLEAPILILQLLHTGHQGRIHAAELSAPLVERGVQARPYSGIFALERGHRYSKERVIRDICHLGRGKFAPAFALRLVGSTT